MPQCWKINVYYSNKGTNMLPFQEIFADKDNTRYNQVKTLGYLGGGTTSSIWRFLGQGSRPQLPSMPQLWQYQILIPLCQAGYQTRPQQ